MCVCDLDLLTHCLTSEYRGPSLRKQQQKQQQHREANCQGLHYFTLQLHHIHFSNLCLHLPLVSTHALVALETGLSNQIKPDCHMGMEGMKEERDPSSVAAGENKESNRCRREQQIFYKSQFLNLGVETQPDVCRRSI